MLPLIVNFGLCSGAVALGIHIARDYLGDTGASTWAWLGLAAIGAVLGLLLFILLQPVVGAPFVDFLSEKVEVLVRGRAPQVGIVASTWRAIWHGLLKSACYGGFLLLSVVLSAFTGIGGIFGLVGYALTLAYDGFDYPLARRGRGFAAKWGYLAVHPGQTVGYCLGATVLYLVPFAMLVAPSFAAVGATLAYLDSPAKDEPT